jgi:drug/metabolite transporter (DMT)-like permease
MFSALLLLPMLFLHKDNFKEPYRLTKNQWLLSILSGAFLALHYGLWFESLRFTSVASSTVFVTLQPLFSFIGGYFFFGEKLKCFSICGGILAIVGSFIIGWGNFSYIF